MTKYADGLTRRGFLGAAALGAGAAAGFGGLLAAPAVLGQGAKLKVGVMLPTSGTFASVGEAVLNGFKLALAEAGGKAGGREVDLVLLDDESDPSKAASNANRLIVRDKVDLLVGTVHSGVAMAMVKVVRDTGTILINPNAGANAITGGLCAPNIFRTSFSNWQLAHCMGRTLAERGRKRVVTVTWKYVTGEEMVDGFKGAFTAAGGEVVKELSLSFPNVEFQPILTEIARLQPDAVYAFFGGAGAVKFMKDYNAAGLHRTIPLVGPGSLTDGTLEAAGDVANGVLTTQHYADDLSLPRSVAFRTAYRKAFQANPDIFAVQGYDTGQLLVSGLAAVGGDAGARDAVISAFEMVEFESPRGRWFFSRAHNPIQDIYLREAAGGQNRMVGIAAKVLEDPASGCRNV